MKSLTAHRASNCALIFIACFMMAVLINPALSRAANKVDPVKHEAARDMPDSFKSGLRELAKANDLKWLCYYGPDRNVLQLPGYKLLVLEADALGQLTKAEKEERICVAYMSIGEIARSRWFWHLVQDKPWLLGDNPEWSGSVRVDPRSQEWSDLLVHRIAPALLAKGYDGLMLDNVDIGEYLEQKDPEKYAGAKKAVEEIIKRLRDAYPQAALVTNGGLETAAEAAHNLDAAVCESIFSRWVANDGGSISYENVSPQDRAWMRPRLLRVRGAGLPVLALEYVAPDDAEGRERVLQEARKAGYFPYIAQRSLLSLPVRHGGDAAQ